MKTVSEDYTDKEEAEQRKPVELYRIWRDSVEWCYTDGDVAVSFGGKTYTPATLTRSSVNYDNKMDITNLQITTPHLTTPVLEYIASNPVDILWISVIKLHRDMSPLEGDVVFVGQIKNVSFRGSNATVTCAGFEYFLKKVIPTWRYQLTCNHNVFDTNCKLVAGSFTYGISVTVDATGTILTSPSLYAIAGWWVGGQVSYAYEFRTVVAQTDTTVTLMYKMKDLAPGSTATIYIRPGCDGRAETCRDKFNNILNFLGFPFIPVENPALRAKW